MTASAAPSPTFCGIRVTALCSGATSGLSVLLPASLRSPQAQALGNAGAEVGIHLRPVVVDRAFLDGRIADAGISSLHWIAGLVTQWSDELLAPLRR